VTARPRVVFEARSACEACGSGTGATTTRATTTSAFPWRLRSASSTAFAPRSASCAAGASVRARSCRPTIARFDLLAGAALAELATLADHVASLRAITGRSAQRAERRGVNRAGVAGCSSAGTCFGGLWLTHCWFDGLWLTDGLS